MSQDEQFIAVAVQAGVATLALNRPPVNVIHIPMLEQIEGALNELAKNREVRALVLRAEGKLFSAGVDVADHTAEKVGEMIPLFDRVCRSLAEFPVPTVAAVHGHALGGGCELVICCDLAFISEEAKIGQPEIQLAVFAPIAALRLPHLCGFRGAADLMFTGRNLTAQEALQLGLVNAVVPPQQVLETALEKARQIAAHSRAAMTLLKKSLLQGYGNWAKNIPAVERIYLDSLMHTHDAHEGLEAFMNKRKPVWKNE